jgi:pimeloyl-ACP methyl ester carboxylesterase
MRSRDREAGGRSARCRSPAPAIAARWLAALVVAGATACESASEPAPPVEVRMFIEANLPGGARDGPSLMPAEVIVAASGPDGLLPTTLVMPVQGSVARGELVVMRHAAAERWRLRAAAAVGGDTLFRVVEDVLLRSDSPRPGIPLVLLYGGRDASLLRVEILPRDTALAVGAAFRPIVTAIDFRGDRVLPAVGWRARQPAVATVDTAGFVTAVAAGEGWIVARSWSGIADSMRVTVR